MAEVGEAQDAFALMQAVRANMVSVTTAHQEAARTSRNLLPTLTLLPILARYF